MSKKQLILLATTLIVLLLCGLGGAVVLFWQFTPFAVGQVAFNAGPTQTATPLPRIERTPVATVSQPTPPPLDPPATAPVGPDQPDQPQTPAQLSTDQLLLAAELPQRDQRLLASRLKAGGQPIPEVVTETAISRQLGERDTFWVTDNQSQPPRQFQVEASLAYVTDHSYWWVQDGFDVNEQALQRSAERFESQTYPTNRAFFGSEWSPGIDGDVRVHIFMGDVPGVAGYFSASNEYSKLAEPYSNEREMFFINLRAISPGNDYFDGVLSHEFQHMIHWFEDRNEDTWVNEGMSELATFLNGYGPSSFIGAFTATPDTQLTGWADTPGAATANYGGSFMFMAYFLQRYGEEMTQAVVAHPENGIAGFNAVLAEQGYPEQFDAVFADFLVANYLQDPAAGDGHWGYRDFSPGASAIRKLYRVYPQTEQNTVYQYGGDYVELTGFGDVTIEFTGSTQVPVVANEAHSGRYQWYSHRGDDSNTRLTRAFDLSGVEQATLHYWTWYDIEPDWDYAYVEISTDGGTSWTILQTPNSATTNPSGNAYGPGYTGSSDGWLEEQLDISAYTGQEVLIRFEYVTDDAVNRPGWTVDDISIPEIDFFDDAEAGDNAWQAEGFVRIDNILPQRFAVRVIEIGEEITVRTLPLDETNSGVLTVEGLGERVERAVLVTSGLAPVTSEPASYEYTLTATGQ